MENALRMKCPNCGANVRFEEGKIAACCEYCGSAVYWSAEQEAADREEETIGDAEEQRRIAEIEKKKKTLHKLLPLFIVLSAVIALGMGILLFCGLYTEIMEEPLILLGLMPTLAFAAGIPWIVYGGIASELNSKKKIVQEHLIHIPHAINEYQKMDFSVVADILRHSGFFNVTCIPLRDMVFGFSKKLGKVESITVNGETMIFGQAVKPDSTILISYHSRKNEKSKEKSPL